MKLIIDIDEDIYKMVCITGTFGRFRYNTAKAIKAGIPLEEEFEQIKAEIELMDFDFGDYYDNTGTIIEMVSKVIDKHISELKGENK